MFHQSPIHLVDECKNKDGGVFLFEKEYPVLPSILTGLECVNI